MTTIANQRPAPDLLDIRLAGGVALLHIKNHCRPAPFNSRIGCDIGLAGSCSLDFATRSGRPCICIGHCLHDLSKVSSSGTSSTRHCMQFRFCDKKLTASHILALYTGMPRRIAIRS